MFRSLDTTHLIQLFHCFTKHHSARHVLKLLCSNGNIISVASYKYQCFSFSALPKMVRRCWQVWNIYQDITNFTTKGVKICIFSLKDRSLCTETCYRLNAVLRILSSLWDQNTANANRNPAFSVALAILWGHNPNDLRSAAWRRTPLFKRERHEIPVSSWCHCFRPTDPVPSSRIQRERTAFSAWRRNPATPLVDRAVTQRITRFTVGWYRRFQSARAGVSDYRVLSHHPCALYDGVTRCARLCFDWQKDIRAYLHGVLSRKGCVRDFFIRQHPFPSGVMSFPLAFRLQ